MRGSGTGCIQCGCEVGSSWGSVCPCTSCATVGCQVKVSYLSYFLKSLLERGVAPRRSTQRMLDSRFRTCRRSYETAFLFANASAFFYSAVIRETLFQIDNILILSNHGNIPPGMDDFLIKVCMQNSFYLRSSGFWSYLCDCQFRRLVNSNLLSVNVDLSASQASVEEITSQDAAHPNDVRISGFSEQILRFIAERGEGKGLLNFVENIHLLYNLEAKLKEAESKEGAFAFQSGPAEQEQAVSRIKKTDVQGADEPKVRPRFIEFFRACCSSYLISSVSG